MVTGQKYQFKNRCVVSVEETVYDKKQERFVIKTQANSPFTGQVEEEVPINGESILSSFHDISKWVVSKTAVDHNEKDKD